MSNRDWRYSMDDLKSFVREVPDFPKPGINFYDITTLMKNPLAFRMATDRLSWMFSNESVDKVVGMESRGFIFAPILAARFNAGFVPVRKPGKLPADIVDECYSLEYGDDRLEIHRDAIDEGENVLIIDDLIATGGTARAAARLVRTLGGNIVGLGFVIELEALGGRALLPDDRVESLIVY
jgi:adenine phosphoribosyltransferase